jgi:K+-transporting ATPase c subunit
MTAATIALLVVFLGVVLLCLFGEPRVNVLALNLALDGLAPGTGSR